MARARISGSRTRVRLLGWLPFQRGEIERGPVPPKLDTLLQMGVSRDMIEAFVKAIFTFHDTTPPRC